MPVASTSPGRTLTDLLFDKVAEGLCLVAPDGTVVRANAEWLRSTGFTAEQIVGENIIDLFPATRDMALVMHDRARAGHRVEVPRHVQVVNGRESWWEGSIEAVPMNGGTGLLIAAREVSTDQPAGEVERALRQSEGPFRTMADGAPVVLWVTNARGDNEFVNQAYRDFFGGTFEDVEGAKWRPLVHPDDAPSYLETELAAVRERRPFECEARVQRKDGEWRWIVSHGEPHYSVTGQFLGHVGVSLDITERKRAETRMRRIYDADLLGMILWKSDGEVTDCNDQFLAMTGYTRVDLTAGRISWAEITPREWWPRDELARQEVRASGTHRTYEKEWIRKDGSRMPILIGAAAFDDDRAEGISFALDITERKRAEEDLAFVTRLYAVLTRVNEAIVRTRDESSLYAELCQIVAQNDFPLVWVGLVTGNAVVPAASAGAAVEYLREMRVELDGPLGKGPTGTCIREDRPVINDDFALNPTTWPWREATARYGLRASAAFPIHRDGAVIGAVTFYAARAGAFTPAQVKLLESLCADISYALGALAREQQRAQAEMALRVSDQALRDADRRKDEFLGILSHELRNPLAPIRNSTYILRHAAPGSEQARRAQAVIERQAEHMTRLVDDLLDVTRVARGKIELRRSLVDLRGVVWRSADDFGLLMRDRGVHFNVVVPDQQLWAEADATRITQIVGNLLHNASKFTRAGDEVALSVEVKDGAAEIRVRDSGVGIDPELLPRVFHAFTQGTRTLARSEGGLGLGLALVKGIAELHGGSVRAESAGPGKGAEFIVCLPLAEGAPAPCDALVQAQPSNSRRRVLIVDDNHDGAESLADIAKMLGHAVDVAYDGASAIEKARANPPNVVLCDLGLPGMSGYDVARALRADGGNSVLLIAVSGYAQPEDVQRAIEAGFDGHIAKPANVSQIEQLLA